MVSEAQDLDHWLVAGAGRQTDTDHDLNALLCSVSSSGRWGMFQIFPLFSFPLHHCGAGEIEFQRTVFLTKYKPVLL